MNQYADHIRAFRLENEWKRREVHYMAIEKIYEDLDFYDFERLVVKFDGPKFWAALNLTGHNTTLFEDCKCNKEV